MLGFVSFIPLLDGPVVPPNVVSPASRNTLRHREYGNADAGRLVCGSTTLAGSSAKASLKSDALSSLLEPATTSRRQQSRR